MNKLYAIILLFIYSCFSSFAVASSFAQTSSENTETEIVAGSVAEHREIVSIKLIAKKEALPVKKHFFYDYQPDQLNTSLAANFAAPIYLMHCVFRL